LCSTFSAFSLWHVLYENHRGIEVVGDPDVATVGSEFPGTGFWRYADEARYRRALTGYSDLFSCHHSKQQAGELIFGFFDSDFHENYSFMAHTPAGRSLEFLYPVVYPACYMRQRNSRLSQAVGEMLAGLRAQLAFLCGPFLARIRGSPLTV
jgi:hypothetical protein